MTTGPYTIILKAEDDIIGWQAAARTLDAHDIDPQQVFWQVQGGEVKALPLLAGGGIEDLPAVLTPQRRVPAEFMTLIRRQLLHGSPERFAQAYALLHRLKRAPDLMKVASDPQVRRMEHMAKAVGRDIHKMKAFVRFRKLEEDGETHFIAWFEPDHHIVAATAPFFARRFTGMRWSILTPRRCAFWDGEVIHLTQGARKTDAPREDDLEEMWKTYYAAIFNPARLKPKAMRAEMPKKYWKNLPEATLIAPLMQAASGRVRRMIDGQ